MVGHLPMASMPKAQRIYFVPLGIYCCILQGLPEFGQTLLTVNREILE